MPSGAIPADDLIEALVELELTNCTGDERASHTRGLERAAAAVVEDGDENDDGMINRAELERMKRSAEEEVGDTADAVIATLQPSELPRGPHPRRDICHDLIGQRAKVGVVASVAAPLVEREDLESDTCV